MVFESSSRPFTDINRFSEVNGGVVSGGGGVINSPIQMTSYVLLFLIFISKKMHHYFINEALKVRGQKCDKLSPKIV